MEMELDVDVEEKSDSGSGAVSGRDGRPSLFSVSLSSCIFQEMDHLLPLPLATSIACLQHWRTMGRTQKTRRVYSRRVPKEVGEV